VARNPFINGLFGGKSRDRRTKARTEGNRGATRRWCISRDIIMQGTSMISGRIGCELAVLALLMCLSLCVLGIFLCPAIQGPYPVVRGPASALLAARAALRLRTSIMLAARKALCKCLVPSLAIFSRESLSSAEFQSVDLPQSAAILRC
jgi:hypothetical protein